MKSLYTRETYTSSTLVRIRFACSTSIDPTLGWVSIRPHMCFNRSGDGVIWVLSSGGDDKLVDLGNGIEIFILFFYLIMN